MDPHSSNTDDGNNHSSNINYTATRFPLVRLSDAAPPDPPRSMSPGYISHQNSSLHPISPVNNLTGNLSNNHNFLSTVSDYQPSFPHLHQQLQHQSHYSHQHILSSHSLTLEDPTCPSLVSTAESPNRTFFAHVSPRPNEAESIPQDCSISSALHVEEFPQNWLWNASPQITGDSMQIDYIPNQMQEQQQQELSQLDSASHLAFQPFLIHHPVHSMAPSSGIHIQDPIWHPNPLELASRAVVAASAPVVRYESTSPASPATTITEIPSFDPTMGSSESRLLVNHPNKSRSVATSGLLRPSRSDGVGRKSRRSSSKTSGSLHPSGRSGRSRSLVSSPRSPFLSDPNETFGLDLSRTTLPYSLFALQPQNSFHSSIANNGHGNGYFSPVSCSATSSSSSPSISPQLLPLSLLTHPSSLTPTALLTKADSPNEVPGSTTPAFVRIPPPMFQCPMEKCPKSFARAYNLHVHLKTQHHLASKELAAVSPLRAPPSAPPVQTITPEEVTAGTTVLDKSTPLVSRSGSKATDSAILSDQARAPLTSVGKSDSTDKSGGNDNTSFCCSEHFGEGNDGDLLECDSSCLSSALGGSTVGGQGRSFACHVCSRIFSRKHDLHRHIRVHTGSKPYMCTNCNKAFARTDALCRHYKVEDDCRQVLMEVEAVPTLTEGDEKTAAHVRNTTATFK